MSVEVQVRPILLVSFKEVRMLFDQILEGLLTLRVLVEKVPLKNPFVELSVNVFITLKGHQFI